MTNKKFEHSSSFYDETIQTECFNVKKNHIFLNVFFIFISTNVVFNLKQCTLAPAVAAPSAPELLHNPCSV